jgi:hypothetical protein
MIAIIEPGSAYPATLQLVTKMSIDTYNSVQGQQQSSKPRKKEKQERKQSKQENKKERNSGRCIKSCTQRDRRDTESRAEQRDRDRGSAENIVCIPVRPCKMACLGPLPVTVTHKSTHVSLAEKSRCGCCFC